MKKFIDLLFKPKDDDRSILPKEEPTINSSICNVDNSGKEASKRLRFIKEGSHLICKGHPEISDILEGNAIGEEMAFVKSGASSVFSQSLLRLNCINNKNNNDSNNR